MSRINLRLGVALGVFGVMLAFSAALLSPAIGQPTPPPQLVALSTVQPGLWEFKSRNDASANKQICVADPRILLQMRHAGANCSKFVIANEAKLSTVSYKCNGAGHGQTTVKVETPRLIQINSQGIAAQSPFAFSAEGRRIGDCPAGAAGRGSR